MAEAAVTQPHREAGSLLAHVLGRDRSFIIAHADDPLTAEQREALQILVERRTVGEPLQYIIARQEFFKLDFEVTPDVLIPRPETELIVETSLELLQNDPEPYFADIGTGSGCIAISMLNELPEARAALAAGSDGLSVIRRLIGEARPFLRAGGHLVFEIGFGQSEAVEQLVDRGVWTILEIREDLQSIPRTFVLRAK